MGERRKQPGGQCIVRNEVERGEEGGRKRGSQEQSVNVSGGGGKSTMVLEYSSRRRNSHSAFRIQSAHTTYRP